MSEECPKCGDSYFLLDLINKQVICHNCGDRSIPFPKARKRYLRLTVFDRITASPEVLAEKLVYRTGTSNSVGLKMFCYKSTIVSGFWVEKTEAIAATVARLKEVEK